VQEIVAALDALRTGDFQARWDAAKQLDEYGEAMMPPLLLLLQESEADAELQWFIAKILGSLSHPEASVALGQLLERSEDEEVRLEAAQGLANQGSEAVILLSQFLKDPQRQRMAIQALVQIHRPEVVPLLLEAANANSAEVRSLVFEALDRFLDPRIVDVLLAGLNDANPEVRKTAIASLVVRTPEYPAEDLVEHLTPCLEDADLGVAIQAARALGRLGTDRGAIALIQKSREPNLDPIFQKTLIQALGWIGSSVALEGLMTIWKKVAQQKPLQESILQEIVTSVPSSAESAEWISGLVQSSVLEQSPTLRSRAILMLGRIGLPAMQPLLIEYLKDSDYTVRLHVVAALKQIDADLAYACIKQRLQDKEIPPKLAEGLAIALQEW
jgi:HEAT repeat protein